jgi:hypothetical protein
MGFYYEITEFCTAVKPFIFEHLSEQHYDNLFYIDPDILVTASFDEAIYSELENNSILLTPHICAPIEDDAQPNEDAHLKTGTYNLGFLAINCDANSLAMIKWWKRKLIDAGFNEPTRGVFVDQKWINLVPGMFSGVKITRNKGLNMAYWNLHERRLDDKHMVNGQDKLVFFHFSGIPLDNLNEISKYQDRFTLDSRPDLKPIFERYARLVEETQPPEFIVKQAYPFNYYSNGQSISLVARRAYFWMKDELKPPLSSIEAEKTFLNKLNGLGIREPLPGRGRTLSSSDINKKAQKFNIFLKIALRIIGSERYFKLVKYFGYLSSLSHHDFLVNSDKRIISDGRSLLKRDNI